MKSVARMELQPGMILGEDVIVNDNVLLKAGATITNYNIELLVHYAVMCVTIMDDIDLAKTHFEKLRFSEEFKAFEQKHNASLFLYKAQMEYFLSDVSEAPTEILLKIYNNLRSTYQTSAQLLDYLYNLIPNSDQLTYNHCLNSALLGGLFAEWLHMDNDEKETLILSCFFYDIGKLRLPYQILWKSGRLTDDEYELVKKHPVIGYSILSNCKSINQHIKNATIMHHERMNGTGYPYHMSGDKIDIYARYLSIIDTYIAMTSPRTYRDAYTPLQIIEHFEDNMDAYDSSLVIPLLTHIADSQIGLNIQLSDNSIWEVMLTNPAKLSRPILKNEKGEILYLSHQPELKVVKNL